MREFGGSIYYDKTEGIYRWNISKNSMKLYIDDWIKMSLLKKRQLEVWKQMYILKQRSQSEERYLLKNKIRELNSNWEELTFLSNSGELPKWDNPELSSLISYLAGAIDGDGCIWMQRQKTISGEYWYPRVNIASNKEWYINYILSLFSGTKENCSEDERYNSRPLFRGIFHKDTIKYLLDNGIIEKSIIKKEQWKSLRDYYRFQAKGFNSEKIRKIAARIKIFNNSLKRK